MDTTATHAGVAACLVTRAIAPATESLVPAWGSGSRTGTATLRSSPEGITRRTKLPLFPSTGTSCATSHMGRQCTSLSTSGKRGPGEPRGLKERRSVAPRPHIVGQQKHARKQCIVSIKHPMRARIGWGVEGRWGGRKSTNSSHQSVCKGSPLSPVAASRPTHPLNDASPHPCQTLISGFKLYST